MSLHDRQQLLLKLIIESYITTALPVGSNVLVKEAKLDMSGATVRNEMHELEQAGYLTHPHTSAGRIPTEAGYRYYVEHIMEVEPVKKKMQNVLETYAKESDLTERAKAIARYLSDQSQAAVLIALGPNRVYYTGLSHLFAQPEFREYGHTVEISKMFDHYEEHMPELFDAVEEKDFLVLIGQENPLGSVCGTVLVSLGGEGLLTLVGPMRMDYRLTVALAKYIHEMFV